MKRVLVTGGRGFIGRNCVEPLLERGFEVHTVGQTDFERPNGVIWYQGDVLNPIDRSRMLDVVQPSHLLHAAWDLTVPDYMSSSINYRWVAASLDLTHEFAAGGGDRVLFIGSCYEYEWGDAALDERTTPLRPRTQYGKSKAHLFRTVTDLVEATDISMAWSRLFFLYGPHEGRRRLVPRVITSLLSGREAPTSHGLQERDYMYSVDVGSALASLLDSNVDGAVNIGTGEAPPIVDLVSEVAEICGEPNLLRIGAIEGRPGEAPRVAAATDRLRQEVGWNDYTPRREALERTVSWWRKELTK